MMKIARYHAKRLGSIVLLLAIAACSDGNGDVSAGRFVLAGCADSGDCASNPPLQVGGARPANVSIPSDYTPTTRYPLIVVLHGYGASGAVQAAYLGLSARVDSMQYVLLAPDGTINDAGSRFWDVTPACCATEFGTVDDVSYIRGLIEEAAATYSIDTTRIGLFGHSNGGFLTLRMACEASEYFTAAISLAGSTFDDAASCVPGDNPVSIMLLHGDQDATILYEGGELSGDAYPGAVETSRRYAAQAGCKVDDPVAGMNLDVDAVVPGAETTVLAYPDCDRNTEVELWTIVGGPHIPGPWNPDALDIFVDWLTGHPRD